MTRRNIMYTTQEVAKIFKDHGLKLLSEYKGMDKPCTYLCKCGKKVDYSCARNIFYNLKLSCNHTENKKQLLDSQKIQEYKINRKFIKVLIGNYEFKWNIIRNKNKSLNALSYKLCLFDNSSLIIPTVFTLSKGHSDCWYLINSCAKYIEFRFDEKEDIKQILRIVSNTIYSDICLSLPTAKTVTAK